MSAPRVSVIIPTRNRRGFVVEAIESALAQTYRNFEVIVVDDGSTDGTHEAIKAHQDEIKYVHLEGNGGAARARNIGLMHSRGQYVAFLDADDLMLPHHLADLTSIIDADPEIGLVAGSWQYLDEKGRRLPYEVSHERPRFDVESWLYSSPLVICGVLVSREWVRDVGGFDESLERAEEWDLWLRLAHAGCPMAWVPIPLCLIRLHRGQVSREVLRHRRAVFALLDKFFAQHDLAAELKAIEPDARAHHHFHRACREYAAGQLDRAKEDLGLAIQLDPSWLSYPPRRALDALVSWACHPMTDCSPAGFVNLVLNNLPVEALALREFKRQALAGATAAEYFLAHRVGDRTAVLRLFVSLVLRSPSQLGNRGVLSVCLQALVGHTLAGQLRRIWRSASRPLPGTRNALPKISAPN